MSETLIEPMAPPSFDAVTPEPADQNDPPLSPHARMMAEIVERAEERRLAEMAVHEDVTPEPVEPLEPVAEEPPPPAAPVEPPRPALRQVMIGGQPYTVTEDQFLQLAVYGAQQMAAQQAAPQQPEPPPEPRPREQAFEPDNEWLTRTVNAIQFGGPDEAARALGDYTRHVLEMAPRQPPPEQIVETATQRALRQMQLNQDSQIVRSEFPAIFDGNDPIRQRALMASAEAEVHFMRNQAMATGHVLSDLDVYREAGRRTYARFGLGAPQSGLNGTPPASQAALAVQPRAGVEERKRAAPRQPVAVSQRAVSDEPRAPTPGDIVAQLRKARGQPV